MRALAKVVVAAVIVVLLGHTEVRPQNCNDAGSAKFVCGQLGPEDLAVLPGSRWVIASSYPKETGGLRLVHVRDLTTTILLPVERPRERFDRSTYGGCPGSFAAAEPQGFGAHGLYLDPGDGGAHILYVVHHGSRESVEVFEVATTAETPTLTWTGCVVAPDNLSLNSVVALPDGGFAVTSLLTLGTHTIDDVRAGTISGAVWTWSPRSRWAMVPGSETSGPNGLEISPDGRWFYIGAWGSQSIIRLSRGQQPVQREDVKVGFRVDNLRATPDGSILATGQDDRMTASHVIRIAPGTFEVREVMRHPFDDLFSIGTTAVEVENEIWIGSLVGERIARFPKGMSR